ncbi:hypothetical protein [Bacillus sp. Hm123]|uniref:hypothetical protein n=1 Tax=Bacillus sp. Hm123 TaxID=3450745 RepID=UPI003F4351B3
MRFYDYRSLIRSLIQKQQTAKQIEEVCRERGYDGSVSTLNTMIAREGRNSKNNGNKPLFLHQRLLHIIWNFHGPPHEDCFKHIHSKLLSAFPDILLLDKIVSFFRQLFYSKDPQFLMEWIHQHEKKQVSIDLLFHRGTEERPSGYFKQYSGTLKQWCDRRTCESLKNYQTNDVWPSKVSSFKNSSLIGIISYIKKIKPIVRRIVVKLSQKKCKSQFDLTSTVCI